MSLLIEYGVKTQGGAPDPFVMVFTSSQVWTVPDGVDKVDVTVVGGGGAGARAVVVDNDNVRYRGGGGGGSGYVINQYDVIINDRSINVLIGSGGLSSPNAVDGGFSQFENIVANGGIKGGRDGLYPVPGGSGGSGGGAGRDDNRDGFWAPGVGGTNGGNGSGYSGTGGKGQGITTIGINNVRYAGGGGGGGETNIYPGANGGNGGGGNGGTSSNGEPGMINTGGGGGGGGIKSRTTYVGGFAGSGIVLVRWNGA